MALAYLVGSVTQGGADAFAEGQISTALSGQTQRAARVREILFEIPTLAAANGTNLEVALSRRSMSAMPNITDRNVIAKLYRLVALATSGTVLEEKVIRYTFAEEDQLLVVEDPLYLDVDSNATGNANTVYCRIGYELVNISANDRLQLALQSLNEST